jgi:hypothetical protein
VLVQTSPSVLECRPRVLEWPVKRETTSLLYIQERTPSRIAIHITLITRYYHTNTRVSYTATGSFSGTSLVSPAAGLVFFPFAACAARFCSDTFLAVNTVLIRS